VALQAAHRADLRAFEPLAFGRATRSLPRSICASNR
jgi:hypothetical protein